MEGKITMLRLIGSLVIFVTVHRVTMVTGQTTARDCWDLRSKFNITQDGVYKVMSPSGQIVDMRCDMTTDGGGWIVFQKRYKGFLSFDETWNRYKFGFGVLTDEFWMGSDLLHEFTKDEQQRLQVDICNWENIHAFANYDFFTVGSEDDGYRLELAGFNGNAGDALIAGEGGGSFSNNMRFSTPDRDNDISQINCARSFLAGWWFANCYSANLNGLYLFAGPISPPSGFGVRWRTWIDSYSFKGTEMKFRPAHVQTTTPREFSCPITALN